MAGRLAPEANRNSTVVEDRKDTRPEAARRRLHESRDQADACEGIREIVSNLLGCEEMAIFQLDRKQKKLRLIWSFGVDRDSFQLSEVFVESVLPSVISGEAFIVGGHSDAKMGGQGEKASAFVPIEFDGETAGVLALLRLLPQKARIDEQDRELFGVLSREAGRPLFGGTTGGARARERKR